MGQSIRSFFIGLRHRAVIGLVMAVLIPAVSAAERHDFGRVSRGAIIEHDFVLRNSGQSDLALTEVKLSEHIQPMVDFETIPPGGTGTLRIRLDTGVLPDGPYQGKVALYGGQENLIDQFEVAAEIFSPISIEPRPVIFLVSNRGEEAFRSIDLVNNTAIPFEPLLSVNESERFTAALETVQAGFRYRLQVGIRPAGPGGKHREVLLVRSSHPQAPELRIVVNTYLRERIYTFPEAVDMGSLRLADVKENPGMVDGLAQILMVYSKGANDFVAEASTDLEFVKVVSERGPNGDRYQYTLYLAPEKLVPGRIDGFLTIITNDDEFGSLEVPIRGQIL